MTRSVRAQPSCPGHPELRAAIRAPPPRPGLSSRRTPSTGASTCWSGPTGRSHAKPTGWPGLTSRRRRPSRGCQDSVAAPSVPARVRCPPARATRPSNVSRSVKRRRGIGWRRTRRSACKLLVIAAGDTSSRTTYTDSANIDEPVPMDDINLHDSSSMPPTTWRNGRSSARRRSAASPIGIQRRRRSRSSSQCSRTAVTRIR